MTTAGLSSRMHVHTRLAGMVEGLRHGAGWLAVLVGEPGSGKTRLLRTLTNGRDDVTIAWASLAGTAGDAALLAPWLQVAAALDDPDLRTALASVAATTTLDPTSDAVGAVARAMGGVGARRPLLVVLDDMDAADRASIELLAALVPRLASAPVGVVATGHTRPVGSGDRPWGLLGHADEELRLGGLTVGEIAEAATAVVGAVLAADLAAAIHDRTGGNARDVADLLSDLVLAEMADSTRSALFAPVDSRAVDLAERAAQLVEAGDALLVAGRPEAGRVVHTTAAAAARETGQAVLLARAALGLGSGPTGFAVPLLDRGQVALLEEALVALPTGEATWHALVRARLSVALTHDEADDRRVRLAVEALDLARGCHDPRALASALAAMCDVRAGPDHVDERVDAATEIIALTRGADPVGELLGRRLRMVARLEQGDIHGAEADRDAFAAVADLLGEDRFAWYPSLWWAAWHLLHGRHHEAASELDKAWAVGRLAGSDHVEPLCMTHRWWALIEQGEHEQMAPLLGALDSMPTVPWVRVASAVALAERRQFNAAVVQLDAVAPSLADVPMDAEWLPMLAQVAHVVGIVGGHPIAATTYDALVPHRGLHVVEGIAAALLGSVERPLGVLAASLGDRDRAAAHFRAAEDANRRLGGPALVARTLRDAGVALDDALRLEAAAVLYAELGWQRRVQEVRDRARALGGAAAANTRPLGSRLVAPTGTFRRDGDGWVVGWQEATALVGDRKGLHDLAALLDRPGRDVPALDLVSPGGGPGPAIAGDLGPVTDDVARRTYRTRLRELEGDVETARANHDLVAAERAAQERDALVAALARAYGLGGRPRRAGDPAERARTTVTSRIRDAIAHLSAVDAALGRHLDNSIRTGRMCSYRPEMPVDWAR